YARLGQHNALSRRAVGEITDECAIRSENLTEWRLGLREIPQTFVRVLKPPGRPVLLPPWSPAPAIRHRWCQASVAAACLRPTQRGAFVKSPGRVSILQPTKSLLLAVLSFFRLISQSRSRPGCSY